VIAEHFQQNFNGEKQSVQPEPEISPLPITKPTLILENTGSKNISQPGPYPPGGLRPNVEPVSGNLIFGKFSLSKVRFIKF